MFNQNDLGPYQTDSPGKMLRNPSITERMDQRRIQLTAELADLDQAIEVFKSTPQIQVALDTLSKLNIHI